MSIFATLSLPSWIPPDQNSQLEHQTATNQHKKYFTRLASSTALDYIFSPLLVKSERELALMAAICKIGWQVQSGDGKVSAWEWR